MIKLFLLLKYRILIVNKQTRVLFLLDPGPIISKLLQK